MKILFLVLWVGPKWGRGPTIQTLSCRSSIPKRLLQNEETRELAALIAASDCWVTDEDGFEGVVGHEAAKTALEEAVLLPLQHPDLFRQSGLGNQASIKKYPLLG